MLKNCSKLSNISNSTNESLSKLIWRQLSLGWSSTKMLIDTLANRLADIGINRKRKVPPSIQGDFAWGQCPGKRGEYQPGSSIRLPLTNGAKKRMTLNHSIKPIIQRAFIFTQL